MKFKGSITGISVEKSKAISAGVECILAIRLRATGRDDDFGLGVITLESDLGELLPEIKGAFVNAGTMNLSLSETIPVEIDIKRG